MEKRPLRKRFKYWILYYFVRFLIFSANIIPRKAWIRFSGLLGRLAYIVSPKPAQRTIAHLTLAFRNEKSAAEITQLSKRVFKMIGRNSGDILRSVNIKTVEAIDSILTIHGMEYYEKAKAKGKGIVFIASHLGAFELQVKAMVLRGLQPHVIGTALKDDRLNELLMSYRGSMGATAIERGKDSFRLIKTLMKGGSIAILIDQDTKVKSRFVNFFGMPASTPVGATVLAMKTSSTVIPTYIYMDQNMHHQMYFLPEIVLDKTDDEEKDLISNTQKFTLFIEEAVRAHPDQWVWMHERWKTKPGEEII